MSGIDAAQPWNDTDRVYPGLQTRDVFTGELHAWRLRDPDAKPPSDHRDGDLIQVLWLSELEMRYAQAEARISELEARLAKAEAFIAKQNAPARPRPLSMMAPENWLPCGTHIASSAGVHHAGSPTYRDGTDPLD